MPLSCSSSQYPRSPRPSQRAGWCPRPARRGTRRSPLLPANSDSLCDTSRSSTSCCSKHRCGSSSCWCGTRGGRHPAGMSCSMCRYRPPDSRRRDMSRTRTSAVPADCKSGTASTRRMCSSPPRGRRPRARQTSQHRLRRESPRGWLRRRRADWTSHGTWCTRRRLARRPRDRRRTMSAQPHPRPCSPTRAVRQARSLRYGSRR